MNISDKLAESIIEHLECYAQDLRIEADNAQSGQYYQSCLKRLKEVQQDLLILRDIYSGY